MLSLLVGREESYLIIFYIREKKKKKEQKARAKGCVVFYRNISLFLRILSPAMSDKV